MLCAVLLYWSCACSASLPRIVDHRLHCAPTAVAVGAANGQCIACCTHEQSAHCTSRCEGGQHSLDGGLSPVPSRCSPLGPSQNPRTQAHLFVPPHTPPLSGANDIALAGCWCSRQCVCYVPWHLQWFLRMLLECLEPIQGRPGNSAGWVGAGQPAPVDLLWAPAPEHGLPQRMSMYTSADAATTRCAGIQMAPQCET